MTCVCNQLKLKTSEIRTAPTECADCPEYQCEILQTFRSKKVWKYEQCRKQLELVRQNGYQAFLKMQIDGKTPGKTFVSLNYACFVQTSFSNSTILPVSISFNE